LHIVPRYRPFASFKPACAAALLLIAHAAPAGAQTAAANKPQGVLPEALFSVMFRKLAPGGDEFAPFYSWDAFLGLESTAFRAGARAIDVDTIIQTIGTESFGDAVGVAVTGYFLGVRYTHVLPGVTISTGLRHLSSHPARDLDDKEDAVRASGEIIPTVEDPSEYNVLFVKASGTVRWLPLEPDVVAIATPFDFNFHGEWTAHGRPLYLDLRWPLWRGSDAALVFEMQQEIGNNAFDSYSLHLELLRTKQDHGRLGLVFTVSPGHDFHVSPHVGGVMDGVSVGARVTFGG
jgi:hypothetical protein